jgi:hypothetical protein
MYILQSGRGGLPGRGSRITFRPIGQERATKTAPQHVPTVGNKHKKELCHIIEKVIQ